MSRLAEIKRFVLAEFAPDVRADELADDFDLLDNGVVDSLGLLRLIAWIGERYDIPVDEVDLSPNDFRSVEAVDAFVTTNIPALSQEGSR
ncbi:phosphopantetheine-binding protein [Actinokineospora sp. HUAS TT18]|uniref:phosphopantetheine-binding protein n=1 Tax=Actinokineospora sp. HUAS TT18 TaxID=3447451 RepID=UPI003F52638A